MERGDAQVRECGFPALDEELNIPDPGLAHQVYSEDSAVVEVDLEMFVSGKAAKTVVPVTI